MEDLSKSNCLYIRERKRKSVMVCQRKSVMVCHELGSVLGEQMQGVRGASICQHLRERSACKECGGAGICQHQRRRS